MEREIISKESLIERMNQDLLASGDGQDCKFTGIQGLAEVDETGCNWSSANVQCSGVSAEACSEAANTVVAQAKAGYNISS